MLDAAGTESAGVRDDEGADAASTPFVGQWNRLVSTTNWEKGRIICEWRESLFLAGASPQAYSDEAWSRRVGGVTGQHVGRLRRVYERYGQVRDTYAGLFWSHFQATLDWHDAEMWLEGAVQNSWSVSEMRNQRWVASGGVEEQRPRAEEVIETELDEDAAWDSAAKERALSEVHDPAPREADDFRDAESGFVDESTLETGSPADSAERSITAGPFAEVGELPEDLAEAVEALKLAIVRHKMAGWSEVPVEQVLAALEGLKQVALAS